MFPSQGLYGITYIVNLRHQQHKDTERLQAQPEHSNTRHTLMTSQLVEKYKVYLHKICDRNSVVVLTMNSYKMCKKMSDHDHDI